ncbi:MAG: serine/threonine-protein kinase [Planctomycetales bacterium]
MKFLKRFLKTGGKAPAKVDLEKRFEKLGPLGLGTMSKVWKAKDKDRRELVALKVLDSEKLAKLNARFEGREKPSEGAIAVSLDHPNIVTTHEHGIATTGEEFLVMEHIEGSPLTRLIEKKSKRIDKKGLRFLIELAEAFAYLHHHGWIYRDCCPRNVLITEEDYVKLIDFGLVVPDTPEFHKPGNRTGTALYMAPELKQRRKTDHRIDIYSYSVTAYELFAGRLPWPKAKTLESAAQPSLRPCPNCDPPGVPKELENIILKGLEQKPDDRWQAFDHC